jgi:hypothetical protein
LATVGYSCLRQPVFDLRQSLERVLYEPNASTTRDTGQTPSGYSPRLRVPSTMLLSNLLVLTAFGPTSIFSASSNWQRLRSSAFAVPGNASYDYVGMRLCLYYIRMTFSSLPHFLLFERLRMWNHCNMPASSLRHHFSCGRRNCWIGNRISSCRIRICRSY